MKTSQEAQELFIKELDNKLKTPEDAKYVLDKYHFEGLYLEDLKNMAENYNFNLNKTGFINALKREILHEHKDN